MEARARTLIVALSLALLAALALPALADAPADSLLAAARAAAAADRHAESIRLFDAALAADPNLAGPTAGERAYQHLWADDLDAALPLFDAALAEARDDLSLRLGRARCLNWMGRHDEAAAAYAAILDDHPDSEEATLGLAQAERWRGREDRALALLEAARWPIKGERREIRDAIRAEYRPWLELSGGKIHDSDPTDRPWASATLGTWVDPRLALSATVGRSGFDGYGYEAPATRLGAGLLWRPEVDWTLHLNAAWERYAATYVDPYPPATPPDVLERDVDLLALDGWLTWRPGARLRVDVGGFRQAGPTPLTVAEANHLQGATVGVDLGVAPRWTLVLAGGLARYDDGNRRRNARLALRLSDDLGPVSVELEPELRWLDFARTDGVGYWSPDAVQAAGARLRLAGALGERWDWRLEGAAGREKEKNADAVSTGDWSAELGFSAGRARLWAAGGSGKSRLDSAAGYRREWWSLGLRTTFP